MTLEDAVAHLKSLETPEAVAVFLREQGIKAIPCSVQLCAISMFMAARGMKTPRSRYSEGQSIAIGTFNGLPLSITLGPTVEMFMRQFDTGGYPELELKQ